MLFAVHLLGTVCDRVLPRLSPRAALHLDFIHSYFKVKLFSPSSVLIINCSYGFSPLPLQIPGSSYEVARTVAMGALLGVYYQRFLYREPPMSRWGTTFCLEKHFLCRALCSSLCYKSANKTAGYQCCPYTWAAAAEWDLYGRTYTSGHGQRSGLPSLGSLWVQQSVVLEVFKEVCIFRSIYFTSAAGEKSRHISP